MTKTVPFTENNPETLTPLAHALGLSPSLKFHDVYSLSDPSLLSLIPRPCLALIVIIPLTTSWDTNRRAEDAEIQPYDASGPDEPVLWFKQTIGHACGLISVLHATLNGPAADSVKPNSILAHIRDEAFPLHREARAQLLYDSEDLEREHMRFARQGDTVAPDPNTFKNGLHFVTFVKGNDGHLWELEGGRKGPLDRGILGEMEDVLSPKAVELGLGRIFKMEEDVGGDARFSCIALAAVE